MNAVAKTSNQMATVTESDLMTTLKASLYPGASDASVQMVLGYCRAAGLDVMKKPVHIVPIYSKSSGGMVDTVMPGIALYRIEASRTGQYLGKSEPEFGPIRTMKLGGVDVRFPEWCKITVKRLVGNHECIFTAMEFWLENYATAKRDTDAPNAMWKKRAFGQLAKCAEAQALRMAFPEQAGGTNTSDEMEGKSFGPTIEVEPAHPRQSHRERPTDYVQLIQGRLAKCQSTEDVKKVQGQWHVLLGKADDAGEPISNDVHDAVTEAMADCYRDLLDADKEQAERDAQVPANEVPA